MIYKPCNKIFPTVLAVVVVVGVAGLVALVQQGHSIAAVSDATGDSNLTVSGSIASSTLASLDPDEVVLLTDIQQLDSVTLDGSILSDPIFTGFVNFVQPILPLPAGRANPFAPLGGATVANPPSASSHH